MTQMQPTAVLGLIIALVSALSTSQMLYSQEAKNRSERTNRIYCFVGITFFVAGACLVVIPPAISLL